MSTRKSPAEIKSSKNPANPLVCLTAYSTPMAEILDAHCDLILVGDSVGTAVHGMENTLGVTLEMMIMHGQAVMRGVKRACVVVDMPYGTYEHNAENALRNAQRLMKETGCDAVKLEGGEDQAGTIAYLVDHGIPVMGHIGLQPQSVVKEGGYKIKGRSDEEIEHLMVDARAVDEAGAFAVVIEGTQEDVAARLTQAISIPTIGIGASASCDGQVLVIDDMIGMLAGHTPKFVKKYAHVRDTIDEAVKNYAADVRTRAFPTADYIYAPKKEPAA